MVMQRMHPDDMPVVRQELDRAERDRDGFELEHRLLMPDGSVKHLHVVARAMDETPELHFVGAVMDVTAARNAQDELALAQAEVARVTRVTVLGQLTASIAHEVSQPLAAIVANGEAAQNWLRRDPPELEEVRDSVRRMVENGRRAGEVVQRIRALSRKSGPEMARLDVNGVVHDSVPLVRREITDQRIALRLELGEDVPEVLGDRVQLQQVVINLLINAVQAMAGVADRPRELAIQSSRDGDGQVLVSVRDTGVGIEPASADRLFDPFYTTKTDGMGIGLPICRTIIEAHGGRLWALGSPGVGADFRFCLPSADA
jgi:C4-dicarboxylate-specific signal transduction histidine kinase